MLAASTARRRGRGGGADLARQLRIAQLDSPLFDVETQLREVKRQLVHVAEQPSERDPVVSREIPPEHRALVVLDEAANGVADLDAPHCRARKLRPHGLKRPLARFRPVDLAALGIELTAVLGHEPDVDQWMV